jgi:hypothetical protein
VWASANRIWKTQDGEDGEGMRPCWRLMRLNRYIEVETLDGWRVVRRGKVDGPLEAHVINGLVGLGQG